MEYFDGCTADKIKGTANEAIGKAKQGIGEATGSERLEGEGVIQEVKGKGQKAIGDAKEATKDAVNKAAEAANKKSLIDDVDGMERPVLGAGLFCSCSPHSAYRRSWTGLSRPHERIAT